MIRQALKEDVHEVIPLLLDAIGTIAYTLAGTENMEEAARILAAFYLEEGNRISYKHVIVDKREDGIAGMLVSYPGDKAAALDAPLANRSGRMKGISTGDDIVVEAQHGEFYLDSIAVNERYRRQGVARGLIAAFEQRGTAEGYRKLSLIVEQDHSQAYALYSKLGYAEDGDLIVSGGRYIRMVKQME